MRRGGCAVARLVPTPTPTQAVAVRPFVTDLTDTFAAIARSKRLQFVANVAPDVPAVVMADDLRLQQALGNLLGAPFSFLSPPSPQNQRPRRVARRCKDGHVLTNAGCIGLKPRDGGGGGGAILVLQATPSSLRRQAESSWRCGWRVGRPRRCQPCSTTWTRAGAAARPS